ncbi:hypothetical protein ASZ90_009747 [hydrocarbon metagenome]|uniref:Uncharacterized protein n=1 Tax=hydrocarbon metagenome TaxID=938273 RepID=A0A0W8FHZ4_9ZZZZ
MPGGREYLIEALRRECPPWIRAHGRRKAASQSLLPPEYGTNKQSSG